MVLYSLSISTLVFIIRILKWLSTGQLSKKEKKNSGLSAKKHFCCPPQKVARQDFAKYWIAYLILPQAYLLKQRAWDIQTLWSVASLALFATAYIVYIVVVPRAITSNFWQVGASFISLGQPETCYFEHWSKGVFVGFSSERHAKFKEREDSIWWWLSYSFS